VRSYIRVTRSSKWGGKGGLTKIRPPFDLGSALTWKVASPDDECVTPLEQSQFPTPELRWNGRFPDGVLR
jgi:hypothetical protein